MLIFLLGYSLSLAGNITENQITGNFASLDMLFDREMGYLQILERKNNNILDINRKIQESFASTATLSTYETKTNFIHMEKP